jgi:UDP-perosamine 4-acetyltransferase
LKNKIAIIGSGMMAREVYHILIESNFEPVGFIDNVKPKTNSLPAAWLGGDEELSNLPDDGIDCFCLAVGDQFIRETLFDRAQEAGLYGPLVVHPSAVILTPLADLGEGTIVYPNAVVMNDCTIGRGVVINSGSQVAHDCRIGDFVNLNPNSTLGGKVSVGLRSMVGMGASVREGIEIGPESIVGMGAAVIRDVVEGNTVLGIPAKQVSVK